MHAILLKTVSSTFWAQKFTVISKGRKLVKSINMLFWLVVAFGFLLLYLLRFYSKVRNLSPEFQERKAWLKLCSFISSSAILQSQRIYHSFVAYQFAVKILSVAASFILRSTANAHDPDASPLLSSYNLSDIYLKQFGSSTNVVTLSALKEKILTELDRFKKTWNKQKLAKKGGSMASELFWWQIWTVF